MQLKLFKIYELNNRAVSFIILQNRTLYQQWSLWHQDETNVCKIFMLTFNYIVYPIFCSGQVVTEPLLLKSHYVIIFVLLLNDLGSIYL